jgi:hypothetical protein
VLLVLGVKNYIGGFHKFIGENRFLLAEFTYLLAISGIYWRKSKFIGELEISRVFFQFN